MYTAHLVIYNCWIGRERNRHRDELHSIMMVEEIVFMAGEIHWRQLKISTIWKGFQIGQKMTAQHPELTKVRKGISGEAL